MAKFTPRAQTEANDDGLKEKMIAVNRATRSIGSDACADVSAT